MYRHVLAGREKTLGLDHQDTLQSARELGVTLKRQGKYDEAEVMHRRAVNPSVQSVRLWGWTGRTGILASVRRTARDGLAGTTGVSGCGRCCAT